MPVRSVKMTADKQPNNEDRDAINISDILLLQRSIVKLDTLSTYVSFLADVNLNKTVKDLDKLFIDMQEHPSRYVHFSIFGKKEKAEKKKKLRKSAAL